MQLQYNDRIYILNEKTADGGDLFFLIRLKLSVLLTALSSQPFTHNPVEYIQPKSTSKCILGNIGNH